MIIKKCTYYILLLVIFFTANLSLNAQTVEIRTDKNQLLIGERVEYELIISLPQQGYDVYFDLPDSITHFDAIDKGRFDTTANNGALSLRRKIIFTSFDSGSWYFPSLPVTLEKNKESKRFMTDSVLINVSYSPTDSTSELRDIKPIMEVNVKNYFWLYVVGLALIFLAIVTVVVLYFIKRSRKPLPVLHSTLSPYEQAMNELKTLSKYSLNIPDDVKQYHSQLSFIFKRYYSRKIGTVLLNKTTGDFLLELNEQQEEGPLISSIAEALRIGDAVKFAKYIPAVSQSEHCILQVTEAVEKIEKNKQNPGLF